MAALVADVTRINNLTEKFGQQRLEEGFAYSAESYLGSQLATDNNTSEVRFASHHSAWLICERTPAKGKLEKRSKAHSVSRNLLNLSDRESPPVASEVRIVKVGSGKRNLRRNQAAKSANEENGFELVKDRLNIVLKENDGGLDLSSSSDDELRELNSCKNEALETNFEENLESAETLCTRSSSLAKDQGDKDTRRKRNKICRGSLKKKLKVSRPCLDLEKMLTRRVEETENNKTPENIFHPIHQM